MTRAREIGHVLLLGAAFGVLVAVIKGQDVGVRDALGNMSAPWVLVPFLAGTRCTKLWQGALVGVAATLAAFLGFYGAEAAILDLGPHPWYVDLQLTLGSGHLYEKWGIPTGLLFGALGAMWAARRLAVAPIAVCLAFVAEPAIVWLATRAGVWGGGWLFDYRWLWISELLLGCAGILFVLLLADRRRRPVSQ